MWKFNKKSMIGLLCSVRCPGMPILKAFDWMRQIRDSGITVISGFHSPLEKECLSILLRGKQPIVICPARRIETMRIPKAWRDALESGRLMICSPFETKVCRVGSNRVVCGLAHQRNHKLEENLTESTNKFLDSIKKFEEDLEDEEEPVISDETRQKLKKHRETLEERIPHFQSHSQAANKDELEEMEDYLHSLLASPEAIIQNQLAFGKGSLGEELVRLLALLMGLPTQLAASRHAETRSSLILSDYFNRSTKISAWRRLVMPRSAGFPSCRKMVFSNKGFSF
jgi:gas vesicle protein